MLDNINSIFFIKTLFSYVQEGKKLEFSKYNKSLQNKIEINLINYKLFSGRYIKYENNKFAREYSIANDNIKYEGEYLNGKRNGKGKEFLGNGKISFEGEYLNGKRNGKGKEFLGDGKVFFEGYYLNGKKWNGNGYKQKTNIIYEIKDGKILMKDKSSKDIIFEGEYINGEINGKGKLYYNSGKLSFEGEFFYGKKWNGKLYDSENNIICELKKGQGIRKKMMSDKEKTIEGEYKNGTISGKVNEYYKWEKIYEGYFFMLKEMEKEKSFGKIN